MRHAARIALLALLFAALPLRGYAGVLMALCEGQHGGNGTSQEYAHGQHAHEHGNTHQHEAPGGDSGNASHAASVCSVCASCCASAGLAAPSDLEVVFQPPSTIRIPFLVRQVSGFVPDHLDRPPLAS
jgi:hypothetical protein